MGGRASPCSRLERERPDWGSLGTGTGAGTGGEERLGDLDKRGVVADQPLSRPASSLRGAVEGRGCGEGRRRKVLSLDLHCATGIRMCAGIMHY